MDQQYAGHYYTGVGPRYVDGGLSSLAQGPSLTLLHQLRNLQDSNFQNLTDSNSRLIIALPLLILLSTFYVTIISMISVILIVLGLVGIAFFLLNRKSTSSQ